MPDIPLNDLLVALYFDLLNCRNACWRRKDHKTACVYERIAYRVGKILDLFDEDSEDFEESLEFLTKYRERVLDNFFNG